MTDSSEQQEALTPRVRAIVSVRDRLMALSPRAKQWLEKTCECLDEGVEYISHAPSRTECRRAGLITQKPFGRVEISAEVMRLVWIELCFRSSH